MPEKKTAADAAGPGATEVVWKRGAEAADEFVEPTHQPGSLGLAHYDVIEPLGRGGFGVVMRAFDRKLLRPVAIKLMSGESAADPVARSKFAREARSAAAVRHPNVVHIYAVEERPTPYLVMEYLPGGSLQKHLDANGPLPLPEVLRVGIQIARGLEAAHAAGLVHRDIKPANVLLDAGPELRVKITDFGLARLASASDTRSGSVVGTPLYMAPEQARGEAIDHRADLFSLGTVLFALACGRPPVLGDDTQDVLRKVAGHGTRTLIDAALVPDRLATIITKLHAAAPADRYPTAAAVAAALAQTLAECEHGTPRRRLRPAAVAAGTLACVLATAVIAWPARTPPVAPVAESIDRFTNALGMRFVRVPAGSAWLGGRAGQPGDERVTIAADFYLGVFEVTQAEWDAVMGPGTNPSRFSRRGQNAATVADVPDAELARFPADAVSWTQAQEFVARLNQLAPEPGWVYRLPTGAEWEYACRGGPADDRAASAFDFDTGGPADALAADRANFGGGLGRTCAVGSYPANRLGLHDLHGNVFEWCDDRNVTPPEPDQPFRGGQYGDGPRLCRAGHVGGGTATAGYDGGGLRVARVRR